MRRPLAAAALAAGLAVAPPARAALDPAHAQADVDAAMAEHDWSFCRAPHEPLTPRAVDLCAHANAVPRCEGLAAACAKARASAPDESVPWWWHGLALPRFLGPLVRSLVWLLVAMLIAVVTVPIARGLLRLRRSPRPADPEREAGGTPAAPLDAAGPGDEEELLTRGAELARRGDFAAALQVYLAAALRALDRRGVVRLARDRTNGEYVRGCGDAEAKPALRDIVREVDRVQFGGAAATPESAARAAERALSIVRSPEAERA